MASADSPIDDLAAHLRTLHIPTSTPATESVVAAASGLPFLPRDIAQSLSAGRGDPEATTCIFDMDVAVATDMLQRHLTWKRAKGSEAWNLVSWTSSLPYALANAFYRRARDREDFEDIELYVLDTSLFPKDVFICDLDLISFFVNDDAKLGALPLTGLCARDSVGDMMENGLMDLHPLFRDEFANWTEVTEDWVKATVQMREPVYQPHDSTTDGRADEVDEVDGLGMSRIGELFGPRFRGPVALAFLSLAPRRASAVAVLDNFTKLGKPWDPKSENCTDLARNVNPDNRVPEVAEFVQNFNLVHAGFYETQVQKGQQVAQRGGDQPSHLCDSLTLADNDDDDDDEDGDDEGGDALRILKCERESRALKQKQQVENTKLPEEI
ncbi:hypothetical protein ISF_06983 [Cordyceps fumosorosea ARSEF 2679]|uniref:Uncharacterized protein n=1 Tax=Cordyceps fumosorosea (strain ARSEF 2679) TaxID=1081104 RepID=A0A167QLB6_CORFA|nr:hypothetical protein ISF_06983 [Cordyceps fumosorosea ARSEF 2679]OAA57742.1 hypothetical protein ISF_06983 [Cordyceps fumosorosea ARSEF 2679]